MVAQAIGTRSRPSAPSPEFDDLPHVIASVARQSSARHPGLDPGSALASTPPAESHSDRGKYAFEIMGGRDCRADRWRQFIDTSPGWLWLLLGAQGSIVNVLDETLQAELHWWMLRVADQFIQA